MAEKNRETEKYRFQQGSLYEYDENLHAYIHCFKQAGINTKIAAIREYEKQLFNEQEEMHNLCQ